MVIDWQDRTMLAIHAFECFLSMISAKSSDPNIRRRYLSFAAYHHGVMEEHITSALQVLGDQAP